MRTGSVERVAAGARTRRVRVVDRETLLLDRVHEVDGGAHQVRGAHLVGHHPDTAEIGHDVAVDLTLVEVQLVPQAGAATRLHRDPQLEVIAAFLGKQVAHLGGGTLSEDDTLRGLLLNSHVSSLVCGYCLNQAGLAMLANATRYQRYVVSGHS